MKTIQNHQYAEGVLSGVLSVAGEPDFQFIVACNVFIHLNVASISFYKTYLHIF